MKVFVTGGTGFIGGHLVERLAQDGHELRCLVRETSDVSLLEKVGATLIAGDVTDKASVLEGMKDCDWVANLAAVYETWVPNRQIYTDVNVHGIRNVMECALEEGVSKVVHVSTSVIYGKPADCPFTEESPVGPVRFSEYAESKYEGDLFAWKLSEQRRLPLVVIYPGAVLGPRDCKATGRYIQNQIRRRVPARVFTETVFTWVHVRDVAEIIVRALEKEGNVGEKYLAGTHQLSYQEFSEMIGDISGVPIPRLRLPNLLVRWCAALLTWLAKLTKKPPMLEMSVDQMRTMKEGLRFDGSKAERELGIAYTPIRTAVEEAIASYKERPA
jgi:dihydroflavonol-4-reductase